MTVEFLYSRFYLFGDEAVPEYIKKCLPDAEFVFTEIDDKPSFADRDVDFIYMGGMSERDRDRVIKALQPYRERLLELIDGGTHILFTSTSLDLCGSEIDSDGEKTRGLDLFPFHVTEHLMKRFSGFIVGKFGDTDIGGFTARFTECFADGEIGEFVKLERGIGFNKAAKFEGIHKNNFYATECIGPFVIINPTFMKKFLSEITGDEVVLPYEELQMKCLEQRLTELRDEQREI